MVGITLSPEQIRQAPPEVRRWLEEQIAATLGLHVAAPAVHPPQHQLVACGLHEARAILSLIQSMLPVVAVFFELGREPFAISPQGLRALRLDEIARHVRLASAEQVVACLEAIDTALQRVTGNPEAALTAVDAAGHCVLADTTARAILALWQGLVGGPAEPAAETQPAHPAAFGSSPYAVQIPPHVPQPAGAEPG